MRFCRGVYDGIKNYFGLPMKIAYVITDYTYWGGLERVLSNKVNYLIEQGWEVSVIAYKPVDRDAFYPFDERTKFYHLTGWGGGGDKYTTEKKTQGFVDKLEELLFRIKPDITVSVAKNLGLAVGRCKDGSIKIAEAHSSTYRRKNYMLRLEKIPILNLWPRYYLRKERRCLPGFDRFVLLTEEDRESWRKLNNVAVIPNPLSFLPKLRSDAQQKRVVSLGRITYAKGFDILVDMWRDVSPRFPDWHLDIYGGGEERKLIKLQRKIDKAGLADRVTIHGAVKDVERELVKGSVYAMTSRYEGFGLALIEAMACGLPPVAFACKCGPRDIIKDETDGFLIKANDRKSYIRQLCRLMESAELRSETGLRAAENVMRFSQERVMSMWADLFCELNADRGRR